KRAALAGWIETELKNRYFVPPRRSREWIKGSRLILLLDGLDEVAAESQSACVEAINLFLENTGAPGIAVCSRLAEYLALPARLRFTGAVCLQPLTPQQIDEFLERGGTQLAAVREAVKTDGLLQELARSPLLLNIISLAYGGAAIETIAGSGGGTVERRRRHLFDHYVQRMFLRVPNAPAAYPEPATRTWLNWLAARMREHSLTLFSLDQLQPGWLPSSRERWRYAFASRIASAMVWAFCVWAFSLLLVAEWRAIWFRGTVFVMLAGIVAGGIAGAVDGRRLTRLARVRGKWPERFRVAGLVALHTVALGAVFAAVSVLFTTPIDPLLLQQFGVPQHLIGWRADAINGLRSGLLFGLMFGLRGIRTSPTTDIRLVEALRLSWASARRGARRAAIAGGILGLALASLIVGSRWEQHRNDPALVVVVSVLVVAGIVSLYFAIIGATFGMFSPGDLPRKVRPGHWLQRSVQNAVLAGIAIATVAAIIFVPWAFLPHGPWAVGPTLLNCCALGIAAAFWYGGIDAIQHLVLRRMLRRSGWIPKAFVAFLDHAARLIFLQKVGSGYLFVHRQLLEYFAEQREKR
ncbi:MAG: NACHT domain-containing protein, partial [Opitutaceae bacterium]